MMEDSILMCLQCTVHGGASNNAGGDMGEAGGGRQQDRGWEEVLCASAAWGPVREVVKTYAPTVRLRVHSTFKRVPSAKGPTDFVEMAAGSQEEKSKVCSVIPYARSKKKQWYF